MERKFEEVNPLLNQTGPMIENWVAQNAHQSEGVAKQQKEYLQMFFLVLQVRRKKWIPNGNCHSDIVFLGLLLPDARPGEVCENCSEAAAAVNSDHHGAWLARG